MGFDGTITLAVGAAIVTLFKAGYGYLHKKVSDYQHSAAKLAIVVDQLHFPDSCTSGGRLDGLGQKNCIQQGGYLIVRTGLDTIIYTTDTAQRKVIYRLSPDRRRFVPSYEDELEAIRQVFKDFTH